MERIASFTVDHTVLEHHDFFFNFPEAIRRLNGVAMGFIDHLEG